MAKHLEIETKWDAEQVSRKVFNDRLRKFLKGFSYDAVRARGDDAYYRIGNNNPIRHRTGSGKHELTVKGRLSMDSILVRFEKNLEFAEGVDPVDVHLAFKLAGFGTDAQIYKDCDIYYIQDAGREVQVVWYKATVDRKHWRFFIEVEVPDLNRRKSLRLLRGWHKIMKDLYGLTDEDIVPNSLYEIFTGRKYLVSNGKLR